MRCCSLTWVTKILLQAISNVKCSRGPQVPHPCCKQWWPVAQHVTASQLDQKLNKTLEKYSEYPGNAED